MHMHDAHCLGKGSELVFLFFSLKYEIYMYMYVGVISFKAICIQCILEYPSFDFAVYRRSL